MRRDPITRLTDSEMLSFNTIRLVTKDQDGEEGFSTGFFYRFRRLDNQYTDALVTNRHVLSEARSMRFKFNPRGAGLGPDLASVHNKIETFFEVIETTDWYGHPNPDIDLAIIPYSKIQSRVPNKGMSPYFTFLQRENSPKHEEWIGLTALEPIVVVGYPSGIWDYVNNLPILRRGVTATHPKYDFIGRTEFLIDAAVYQGSSGSPVFLYEAKDIFMGQDLNLGKDRPRFIGVLSMVYHHQQLGEMKTIPIPTKMKAPLTNIPNNLV